jgi:hypothetical protein
VANPTSGDVPVFEISGIGQAPEHGTPAAAGAPPSPSVSAGAPGARAQSSPANTSPGPSQSSKELWLMIVGIAVIVGIGILAFWRMKTKQPAPIVRAKPDPQMPLLDSLKEELFQLESDRLHGAISAEQYAATKQALTESIQRAMSAK